MIWYLNSKLELKLSCVKVFLKPEFYSDFVYMYKLKQIVSSKTFQRSSLK